MDKDLSIPEITGLKSTPKQLNKNVNVDFGQALKLRNVGPQKNPRESGGGKQKDISNQKINLYKTSPQDTGRSFLGKSKDQKQNQDHSFGQDDYADDNSYAKMDYHNPRRSAVLQKSENHFKNSKEEILSSSTADKHKMDNENEYPDRTVEPFDARIIFQRVVKRIRLLQRAM